MGSSISKHKRGRSRATPRRTCQTLISSSKVEAAPMSDRCEIRSDADPIQGASGGPGQVAQVSNLEATHRGSSSRPPLGLLKFPDEFKLLEMDRLLPCDLKNTSPPALLQYDAYLHWFYNSHRGPAPVASLADTASVCLEKEDSMRSLWVASHACSNTNAGIVDDCIANYLCTAIEEKGEIEHPFGIDAAECIAMEAELISEWLRHGRRIFSDDEFTLCNNIRSAAAKLFISRRKWSCPIAAALLGIRKEAEWLIRNLKHNSGDSISTSMKIRQSALKFALEKYGELEPYKNQEISESESESESEMSSDSDYDVAGIEDNYMGDCCDEDYLKLYGFLPGGLLF